MTTRGLLEKDFETVASFVDRAIKLTVKLNQQVKGTKMKDFKDFIGEGQQFDEVTTLKKEVADFANGFPTIGFEESTLRYK
ncbi:hypothetical protein HDU76_013607 [Blyttiomyces sp. JEL0837]|nr:hypothetical protein HDU76_013607 [Blyttiomyces sp. JEL0837]